MILNKLIIVLAIAFIPFLSLAQTDPMDGIRFESGLTWKEILSKAKSENKYIFVDCYATWCGPCKWMTTNIFPDKEVGDYMNAHFISIAVQMDKTAKDDQQTKDRYLDARMLHDLYKVSAYPTYLFFSPDGTPLHRFTGSRENVKIFLDAVGEAFDPAKQYYSTMKEWKNSRNDTTFLFNSYISARKQRDGALADSIGEAYLNAQSALFTRQNMNLISDCNLIQSSKSKWFRLLLNNAAKIDQMMDDQSWVEERLSRVIFEEEVFSLFEKNEGIIDWKEVSSKIQAGYPSIGKKLLTISEKIFRDRISKTLAVAIPKDTTTLNEHDWAELSKNLDEKFPGYDHRQILLGKKADYYAEKNLWASCINTAYSLIKEYGDKISGRDINNICWDYIFLHTANPKILAEAAKWMKKTIDRQPADNWLDTYANLLYKLGQFDLAIKWEHKAIETGLSNHSSSRNLNEYKASLAKMQQRQPTWGN